MAQHVVLSVMSRDRVGIVSAVAKAIFDLEGNIDAMSQTVMRGYFTLIVTADFEHAVALEEIRKRIESSDRRAELAVSVQERDPVAAQAPVVSGGDQFVLTLFGRDRPGIISRMSAYLASRGINIVDLYAHREGDQFLVIGQVMIPRDRDIGQIQIDLEGLWKQGEFTVRLQHENIFVATNEIDFRHIPSRGPQL